MVLKRCAVPGKEAAKSAEPLAAWQPCPHYSWYWSLCFCCPEASFIYFPLNLENRSPFFSYLYQTSGSRDNVNLLVLRRKASTPREFHLLRKGRGYTPVLLHTRRHSFQRAALIQIPWTTSSLLQEVWPASAFADNIPVYSIQCPYLLPERGSHLGSSPQSLGTAQHGAAKSSCCHPEGWSISQIISYTTEGRCGKATSIPCMYMVFEQGTDIGGDMGALNTGIHLSAVPR